MKKRFGLLLATIMVLNTVSSIAYGFTNPLKSYNLYDDTHPSSSDSEDSDTEKGMSEFYENSLSSSSKSSDSKSSYSTDNNTSGESAEGNVAPARRNEVLRESSRKVYGDPSTPAGWLEGPSFYANPSFESIKEKYHKSDFAGCLQECISYVRKNPNDTLGFYYLAMCYSKVSDKENAIKAYEKVIELNANPMIVKYATNGRNCVLGSTEETCYPNVNEPELIYPYADLDTANLTPVDPETLIHRNLVKLQNKLSPLPKKSENDNNNEDKDKEENKIVLPFGQQDAKLDQFINAPYGNGLSPDLNKEYKQIQLKKIQQNLNNESDNPEDDAHNLENILKFDKHKTDSETIKLAYDTPSSDMESFLKDPEYQQSKRELDELRMMLGNNNNSNSDDDLMNLVPYFSDKDKNMSPEMIEAMMVKSMMPDFTFVNNNKNLL